MSDLYSKSPMYLLWCNIKARCHCTTNPGYKYYGARGITIYAGWLNNFPAFNDWILVNLGPKPEGLTLDRIRNGEGYIPGNLRWASRAQQVQNRRSPVCSTNTGERHISHHLTNDTYSVAKPGGLKIQSLHSLSEAISVRNVLWSNQK